MHFWIDKRSQTCGFSGRHRVPTSLGGGRRWRGAKPMVTPVHRFQAVECVTGQYAHSHVRRPTRHAYPTQPSYRLESTGVSTELPVRAHAVELDSSVFLDLPLDSNTLTEEQIIPQLVPVSKLKCGMWTSFVIVSLLVIATKFHYNNQETALEVLIFAGLMIVVLLLVYIISSCRSKATRRGILAAVSASAAYSPAQPPTLPLTHTVTEEPPPPPPSLVEPPPPPYHIAVLLPQKIRADEVPPPSYDKAVS